MELELRGHSVTRQDNVMIRCKHFQREELLKFDLPIGECLLVEVTACDAILRTHKAQKPRPQSGVSAWLFEFWGFGYAVLLFRPFPYLEVR